MKMATGLKQFITIKYDNYPITADPQVGGVIVNDNAIHHFPHEIHSLNTFYNGIHH